MYFENQAPLINQKIAEKKTTLGKGSSKKK